MEIKQLLQKIKTDISERGYVIFSMDCRSTKLDRYTYNVSVSYNNNFSENINFITRNQINSIVNNTTVNLTDLDYAINKLKQEVF